MAKGKTKGDGKRGRSVKRKARLGMVRDLLVEGTPEWQIRELLVSGITLDDGTTMEPISLRQARRDMAVVAEEYRELFDDPDVQERIAGGVLERLIRIALDAERAGKYHAAIRANEKILQVVGMRTPRWTAQRKAGAGGADEELDDGTWRDRARELEGMDDEDLLEHHRRTQERIARLELQVHDGGKGRG